jgi:hypothetical protein
MRELPLNGVAAWLGPTRTYVITDHVLAWTGDGTPSLGFAVQCGRRPLRERGR